MTDKFKILCVLVRGSVGFTPDYVTRLRTMVQNQLPMDHEFVCLTDQPERLPSYVRTIRVPTPSPRRGAWWSKLQLFNPAHGLRGSAMYLDLDVLIVRPLKPVVDVSDATLTLIPHAGDFNGRKGLSVVKRYNSSVMRWRVENHHDLFTEFDESVTDRLWGDQDWIGERLPNQPMMPLEWFPRVSEVKYPPRWPDNAKIVLCKRPKNHVLVQQQPELARYWG